MITITKIFRFETAHAIYGYPGSCANIHGHSYELHVAVQEKKVSDHYIPGLGILIDFKELKSIVQESAIETFDHKLVLSKAYLNNSSNHFPADELVVFDVEPTVENMLVYLSGKIQATLPETVRLVSLKLWETKDSYAEWSAND